MNKQRPEQDFLAFEPLLWRVLSALARRGFAAGPGDARDLIHDFYLDSWRGLNERFDARIGSFATYLASSFYRFARRRIASLQAWRQNLVDVEDLANLAIEFPNPAETLELKEQIIAIKRALSHLPSTERLVLQDYLSESGSSERAIAARHGITRYALRELLLNAVGRVAVEMGRLDPTDVASVVAYYLWRDGRSPKNVSSLVGLPLQEVHRLRSRFAAELLASIRSFDSGRLMEGTTMRRTPLEVLKAALLAVGDEAALATISEKAKAIRDALDEGGDIEFSRPEEHRLTENPEWLARVYANLSMDDSPTADEQAVEDALENIQNEKSQEIGDAFRALLSVLPGEFRDWSGWFDGLPSVARPIAAFFEADPSVVGDKEAMQQLTSYGLTPAIVFGATRSLQLLFDRLSTVTNRDGVFYFSGQAA